MTNPYPPMWKECPECGGRGEVKTGVLDPSSGCEEIIGCPNCSTGKVPIYYTPERYTEETGMKVLDSDPVWMKYTAVDYLGDEGYPVWQLKCGYVWKCEKSRPSLMAFPGVPAPPIDYEEE